VNELRLTETFPPVSVETWEQVIHNDLKGADYDKRLVWKTDDAIAVRPYYTRQDLERLASAFDTAPGQFPFLRGSGRPWQMAGNDNTRVPEVRIEADTWHNQGATTVQELAFTLAAAVEAFSQQQEPLTVRFAIGPNFFFEIAKLRAARLLWSQAAQAFAGDQPTDERTDYLLIHAVTGLTNKTLADPNNNLLRASAEALAAVLGGCDWLTVTPFHFDERLATNVQRILREESYLDRVADPGGGSYYLEVITDALAREAWTLFQQIEANGGFSHFTQSGALDAALAESRRAKETAMAQRRRTLVGVNAYADPSETLPPDETTEWRLAGLFERLRQRTERHRARTGAVPEILLLEAGDLKMRKARSGFCAGFFACAGLPTRTATELSADAALIVLCSSDAEYLDLAQRICSQTSKPVLVAGNPKEHIDALRAAGVAGFVHLTSNAAETLAAWQDRLGMERD
jgi:methylmalonyl-CoA mutase